MTRTTVMTDYPNQSEAAILEDRVEQELLAEGVLDQAPPVPIDYTPYLNRKPFPVQGTPASERLIAERR